MKSLSLRLGFAMLWVTGLPGAASAQGLYASPHDLLVEAIQNGFASGVLGGAVAEHFTNRLQSRTPLLAQATLLQRFAQPGCARLEMILTKDQVATPKGLTQAVMRSRLNYCLDGKPPENTQ